MKLIDYVHHLQQLFDKYGDGDVDTEVNIKTKYEYMSDDDFEYSVGYIKAIRPYYDKKKKCVVVHEDRVSFD